MSTLNIAFTANDDEVLNAADLDVFVTGLETFLNVTKLEAENFQDASIQANNVLPSTFNSDQIRRRTNSYEIFALEEDAITDASLATAIADDSVGVGKREARTSAESTSGSVIISSPATQTISTTAITSVFGSTSITTNGRLVEISLCAAANGSISSLTLNSTSSSNDEDFETVFWLYRDGVAIQSYVYKLDATYSSSASDRTYRIASCVRFYDLPAANTYDYEIQAEKVTGGNIAFTNMVQIIREV